MKALIFDVDGTLAETEEIHRQAFNEIFAETGLDWFWTVEIYAQLLKTTGGKERMRRWRDQINAAVTEETIAALHVQKTKRYGELIANGNVELRTGIEELISYAKAKGLRLAVATTTNRPNVDVLCQASFRSPAEQVFEVVAAGDEVLEKKPAPDVYHLALKRLQLPAEEAVAFEDSANGVLSAKAAGLRVIAAPSLYTGSDNFREADALAEHLSVSLLEDFVSKSV